jgi:hypothetical protein
MGNAVPEGCGAPMSLPLGNNALTTSYGYDARGRVNAMATGSASFLLINYDDASNVKQATDLYANETVSYTYDELNRLKTATGYTGGASASYGYDVTGNLLTKNEGASAMTLCYPAAGSPRPHAVTSAYNTGGAACGAGTPWRSFQYQADGSMLGGGGGGRAYDAENRVTAVLDSPPDTTPGEVGFRCIDTNGDGVINGTEDYLLWRATQQQPPPAIGNSGYNVLMDLDQCSRDALALASVAGAAAALITANPQLAMATLVLWTANVQVAWNDYRRGDGTRGELWGAVFEGALGLRGRGESTPGDVAALAISLFDLARAVACNAAEATC